MARCEQGYLCEVCGAEVEEIADSDLYLRYVLGEVDPEQLHRLPERHIRCNPALGQFIVADGFPALTAEGAFAKSALDPHFVTQEVKRVTRGYQRLKQLERLSLPILEYPLPEVRDRWRSRDETHTTTAEETTPAVAEPLPRVLFLDDDPGRARAFLARHPEAVWVETAEECISRLAEEWDQVHLDHDLGGEIYVNSDRLDCGMEVVRWLCAQPRAHMDETLFIVHTHNAEAAKSMLISLRDRGYQAVYRPFGVDLYDWCDAEELDEILDEGPCEPAPAPLTLTWIERLRRFWQRFQIALSRKANQPPGSSSQPPVP